MYIYVCGISVCLTHMMLKSEAVLRKIESEIIHMLFDLQQLSIKIDTTRLS